MTPGRSLALAAALWAGLELRREVRLAEDTVLVDAAPDEIVDRFRSRLNEGPDVLTAEHDRLVRRFSGRAGRFRYETVELVTLGPTAIGFEHLAGPFAHCRERVTLEPVDDGRTRMTHTGTFVLRGGLWSWPLARTAVKRAFERHVHEHLIALRAELRSSPAL
jgi:hypothetical protein